MCGSQQDYKSLHVAVMICADLVNTHTDRQAHRQLLTSCTKIYMKLKQTQYMIIINHNYENQRHKVIIKH